MRRAWARARELGLVAPLVTALALASIVGAAAAFLSFDRFASTLREPVMSAEVVALEDSDYFRCGRSDDPEKIITARVLAGARSGELLRDQQCLYDLARGDRVRVVDDRGGLVINPPTLLEVVIEGADYAVPVWLLLSIGACINAFSRPRAQEPGAW